MDIEEKRRKKREYMRRYRAERPELRAYQKAYNETYFSDPEKAEANRLRAATWYARNRERALTAARARYDAKPKIGPATGARNANWKGDKVGYFALHEWVKRVRGTPAECEHCGTTSAKRFEWANVDHTYRRAAEDWLRLCTSCHRNYDYANGLAAKGGRPRKVA